MTHPARNIIKNFFGAVGGDAFMSEYWPRTAYHEHGDVGRLPKLFQTPVLKQFETLARVYRGPGFFFAGEGSMLRPLDRPALELYRSGHTVYFGDVAPFIPQSRIFLGALERELGAAPGCARMGVFASPKSDGAAVHYDTNEVFSIQLAGHKSFNLAPVKEVDNPTGIQYSTQARPRAFHYPQMTAGFPDPATAEFSSINMSPGSVLFMPRGTWHHTEASQDSMAVSIIVNPPPAVDAILEQLKFTLLQDPDWRAPLYGAWDPVNTGARAHLADLLAELRRVSEQLTPEQVVRGGANLGYRLEAMDENTRFQVIPTARIQRSPAGSDAWQIKVVSEDLDRGARETLNITVTRKVADMLEWLVSRRGPVYGRDIAARCGDAFADIAELLRDLSRSEFLMPLWFDPIPGGD